ncbi:hypothetical protein RFI_19916 [Reticulomyxa filosa]|uniref:Uncharacterized protein n=1 Tax=Reticulomyxa filosa TaxID=46433 RepID=X6MVE8_RETFI|nr:hypothetical protein RFI_19916 [Reticulomyxa filosa]|eukprot:ETO17407.1 hypothetical protein RFI_19916 [Reticulomyxa filosa]
MSHKQGIYVPTLVMEIEKYAGSNTSVPSLQGFGVGDGCMGIGNKGACGIDQVGLFIDFMWGHGQISNDLYQYTKQTGCYEKYYNGTWEYDSTCDALAVHGELILGGYNVYDIYDTCFLQGCLLFVTRLYK